MECAISAAYTAISFLHAMNNERAAGALYLLIAMIYLAAGRSSRRPPPGGP